MAIFDVTWVRTLAEECGACREEEAKAPSQEKLEKDLSHGKTCPLQSCGTEKDKETHRRAKLRSRRIFLKDFAATKIRIASCKTLESHAVDAKKPAGS